MATPELSPVEISLAAAIALGFRGGQFRRDASPASLNVLLHYDEGCVARCAYCGHHAFRAPSGSEKTFIRVPWPVYPAGEVCERLGSGAHGLRRVCVGMVTHRRAFDDMNALIRLFRERSPLPVSALIAPTMIQDLGALQAVKEAGADRVGIALDAATPELFDRWRGAGVGGPHTWSHYWRAVETAVGIFGRGMVGAHLVVGLGETEQEMVETIQKLHDAGATDAPLLVLP